MIEKDMKRYEKALPIGRCLFYLRGIMKVKRIRIIRPEVNVEFVKPILGRLYFLSILPGMIKVEKVKLNIGCNLLKDGDFRNFKAITVFFIAIPKITFG